MLNVKFPYIAIIVINLQKPVYMRCTNFLIIDIIYIREQ